MHVTYKIQGQKIIATHKFFKLANTERVKMDLNNYNLQVTLLIWTFL